MRTETKLIVRLDETQHSTVKRLINDKLATLRDDQSADAAILESYYNSLLEDLDVTQEVPVLGKNDDPYRVIKASSDKIGEALSLWPYGSSKIDANPSENDEWVQAVGLLSTLHPRLEIDCSDPLGMAKSIEIHVIKYVDLLELAWGLIANASGGNWEKESDEWREAAIRWRNEYHEATCKAPRTARVVGGDELP